MTIQEFYKKWNFWLPLERTEVISDLCSLIRYYGGEPGKDTLTRTEKHKCR